jgi:GNAT superfamily N-acetyltransferase
MSQGSVHRVARLGDADLQQLAEVLLDCVEGGASVSFMHPLTHDRALAFWHGVADGVARGERALLVADDALGICGTVQVVLAQPENQPHRADVAKMLVHRRARQRGPGAALLHAAEDAARAAGKTLQVLDTVAGSDAERLCARRGWRSCGLIPDCARIRSPSRCALRYSPLGRPGRLMPRGGLAATHVFYKRLTSG